MAATNIREFTLGIDQFVDDAEDVRRKRVKAVSLRVVRDVVLGTRVDTGRMRGNWQTTVQQPATGYDPERKDKEGQATIGEGTSAVMSSSGDEMIWMHNGVPYVFVWEDRDRMVEGAVQAATTYLASL